MSKQRMASPPQTTKSTSRWGTFLQQAVAGVESRLDTILADEDTTSKDTKRSEQPTKKESLKVPASTKVQQEGMGLALVLSCSHTDIRQASLDRVQAARTMTVYKSD